MKSDRAAPGEELAHGHRASDAEAEAGDRDDRFSGASSASSPAPRARRGASTDAKPRRDGRRDFRGRLAPASSQRRRVQRRRRRVVERGWGYSDAGSSAGGSRDFDRGGGFASKGGSRGGGALPPTHPSRMHKGSKSTGGSALPSDVLGFSCSFKLPSNSQLCRLFAAMTAFCSCSTPRRAASSTATAPRSLTTSPAAAPRRALGPVSAVRAEPAGSRTQANMANRRGFGDELYGQAQTGAAAARTTRSRGRRRTATPRR